MKKAKFLILCRGRYDVYLKEINGYIDGEFGYHKDERGKWISTDLESGMSTTFKPTRKECKKWTEVNTDFIKREKEKDYYKKYRARFQELKSLIEKEYGYEYNI